MRYAKSGFVVASRDKSLKEMVVLRLFCRRSSGRNDLKTTISSSECLSGRSLCECLLDHHINDSKIASKLLWKGIAFAQVGNTIRTHPNLTVLTLPDKNFEG